MGIFWDYNKTKLGIFIDDKMINLGLKWDSLGTTLGLGRDYALLMTFAFEQKIFAEIHFSIKQKTRQKECFDKIDKQAGLPKISVRVGQRPKRRLK